MAQGSGHRVQGTGHRAQGAGDNVHNSPPGRGEGWVNEI